jgi:hypothetical protein
MAPQNLIGVPSQRLARHLLPIDMVDRVDDLCRRIRGIVDLMGVATMSDDPPADESIADSARAVFDMLAEVKKIAGLREGEA